jgi:thioredoxin-like negative regulator of GroEL
VKSIPCLVFLGRNGEVVDMLHGVKPKHFIRQIIERVKHA